MRKIVGFTLCILLTITLGFTIIHPAYLKLANWLGPFVGNSLLTALTMIFLLLGDPLNFLVLTALWGGVSLFCGIIIRRRVGAVFTMILIFILLIPIMAASIYEIAMNVSEIMQTIEGGNPIDVLPPLPKGLTLAHLYEAPIIGGLIESALEMFKSGGLPSNPQLLIMTLISPILVGVAEKIIIIILASLIGVEAGKLIEPVFTPYLDSIRFSLGGNPRTRLYNFHTFRHLKLIGIILITLSGTLLALPNINAQGDENFYSEIIIGYAEPSGRSYIGDIFLENGTPMENFDTEGLLAGLIFSHEGIGEIIPDLMEMNIDGLESLSNIIPSTVMMTVYLDVPTETAVVRSNSVSSAFSDAFSVSLHKLMDFEPPLSLGNETELPPLTIVLYQSSAVLEDLSKSYLDQFTDNGGLAELIDKASRNGRLIPRTTLNSADGSALFSGFVNLDLINEFTPEYSFEKITKLIPDGLGGLMGVSGGFSYWDHGVESEDKGLDLLSLLGADKDVSFSNDSDISMVLLAAPNGTDIGGEEGDPNIKITTSLSPDDPKMEIIYEILERLRLLTVTSHGEKIEPSSFRIEVSGMTLPLNVEVIKTVSTKTISPNRAVNVTITIRNQDNDAMTDITVDDTLSLSDYTLTTRLVSGTTTTNWSKIEPGQSRSLSYTFELGQSGIYSLSPTNVEYNHGDISFFESSDWLEISVSRPSAVSLGINSIFKTGETVVDILNVTTGGNGNTILMGSTVMILLTLAILEFKNFRKWMS